MKFKSFLIVFLLLFSTQLTAKVFHVNKGQAYLNLILAGTLDYANDLYNDRYIESLTEDDILATSKSDVPFFDRWATYSYDRELDDTSNYLTIASLGKTFLLNSWDDPYTWDNLLVLSEILAVQSVINNWAKSLTLRKRPYVVDETTDLEKKTRQDARFSFYSLHTSTAFAIAVYSHFYQYHTTNNPYIIGSSYALAALVGVSRIASGQHFPSDAITGVVMGSLTSYLLCKSHRSAISRTIIIGKNSLNFQVNF